MAFRINSNIAALNALRHLHDTEEALSTNLERLSSGRKLNHASDGPAAMVISEQMKTQIESLDQSIRNSEISMSMLQTTEGALSEVSNILIDMRQLAVHAANEGTNDPKMLQADQNEIENLLSTLGNISRNTQFGPEPCSMEAIRRPELQSETVLNSSERLKPRNHHRRKVIKSISPRSPQGQCWLVSEC